MDNITHLRRYIMKLKYYKVVVRLLKRTTLRRVSPYVA